MPQDNQTQARAPQYPTQLAAVALRGASQMFDMQLTTMRTLLKTQARAAAAFGLPDCSDMFEGNGSEDRVRQAISTSTEELVHTTQLANEAVADMQRHERRAKLATGVAAIGCANRGVDAAIAPDDGTASRATAARPPIR